MPKSSVNASLSSYDDIFSTEESRQEEQREQVQQIPIGELFPFKNHPFKVLDDDSMSDTVESVKQYGVLSPLIARPRPKGGYEIISGPRRQHAAELAGLETLPPSEDADDTIKTVSHIGTDKDWLAVVNPWNLEECLLILLQCRLALLAADALLRIRWRLSLVR